MPEVAKAAEAAGADAVVVANTILSMAIDLKTFKPCLGNIMGACPGRRSSRSCCAMSSNAPRAVKIPVIGCGGISNADDVIEYMLAGASAIQVGTATFVQPTAMVTILEGLGTVLRGARDSADRRSDRRCGHRRVG